MTDLCELIEKIQPAPLRDIAPWTPHKTETIKKNCVEAKKRGLLTSTNRQFSVTPGWRERVK